MIKFKKLLISLLGFSFSIATHANSLCHSSCTFVLKSEQSGEYSIINPERAVQRMTPWSTFKIPNSLIALDTGVIKNTEVELTFDIADYPIQKWWPKTWYEAPISLRNSYKYSAVPIYQDTASKINKKRMSQYLADFQYGNQDISSGIDNFWLNKSIKISAKEQVDFLQRLYNHELAVSKSSLMQLKDIMLAESTEDYKLYAKTGAGGVAKDKALGWYVGFIETKKGTYYFSLNIDGKSFKEVIKTRIDAAKEQLSLAGII